MKIIDSHVHLFDSIGGTFNHNPMRGASYGRALVGSSVLQLLPPSFENSASTYETLIAYMDWCGISQALLMPNPLYGYFNDYYIEAIQHHPRRLRGVALVNPLEGKSAADELQAIYDTSPLFGFKIEVNSTFSFAPDKHILSPELMPVYDCINQNHQPIFIHMLHPEDIGRVRKLSVQFPDITWIFCHMGADACFGKGYNESLFHELLSLTASREKFYLETSTVECYFDEEYPFPSTVHILETAYQKLGADKIMWGSDYPGLLMKGTMEQLINIVASQCRQIPSSHREKIMYHTARELFFQT